MNEFELRREKLLSRLKEGSLVLVHAGTAKVSSEDETFPFDVNKNFYYLTGIKQENSVLMLVKGIGENKTYLFIDKYDPTKEKWTGKRITPEEASNTSGIANILFTDALETKIELGLAKNSTYFGKIDRLYIDEGIELKVAEDLFMPQYLEILKNKYPHLEFVNLRPDMIELRLIKSPYEIECLRKSINLTQHGINQMLMNLKPGKREYQLTNIFDFYGQEQDRTPLAFTTICATGKNACCLHYTTEMDTIKPNDLILFDLGYSLNGYSADISRTFPVSGKFTDLQRKIYETVLLCNKAVIEYIKEGLTLKELQEYASNFLKNECVRLGLLKPEDNIFKVYPHSVSHHLGLDTHDISDGNRNREKPLVAGNVITVEPGLYFDDLGIGVRIEDDVLVTKTGAEVLSKDIKKEVNDIEQMLAFLRK